MISPTLPCFHPLFLPKSFIGVDDDDHGGLESMKILKDPFATLHHSSFCVMCLCTGSTYTIQGITRGGFTIEFSEMRGPNKIFGPFCEINEPNILFGPLISENSIITPPLATRCLNLKIDSNRVSAIGFNIVSFYDPYIKRSFRGQTTLAT